MLALVELDDYISLKTEQIGRLGDAIHQNSRVTRAESADERVKFCWQEAGREAPPESINVCNGMQLLASYHPCLNK